MKKFLFMVVLLNLFSFLIICPACAQDRNVSVELTQLRNELLNSKLPLKDVNSVAQTLRALLNQGSSVGELRSITLSIAKKGISGTDLNTSLESVNVLVEAGVKTNEAGNVVLGGIDKGLALGFKGGDFGLMDNVREAVKQKKAQLLEEMKKKSAETANPSTDTVSK
ncbi:MAG: hypothetical protein M0R17_06630 [Candidatus Omnitrophica bacterium]|jgi:hypothetical protein|nr:hypothetical protein [Candidatus Omnitrophota bacterium]MDD5253084.1 hypothetical protein [Candidatus Omnitrophota bacterium]